MPFKSRAQQRFMHAAAGRGEISKQTVHEFDQATDFSKLPARAGGKKRAPMKSGGRPFGKLKGSLAHMSAPTKKKAHAGPDLRQMSLMKGRKHGAY